MSSIRRSDLAYLLFYLAQSPKLFENHDISLDVLDFSIRKKVEKCIADFGSDNIDQSSFTSKITQINAKYCQEFALSDYHYLGGDSFPDLKDLIKRSKSNARENIVDHILYNHSEDKFEGGDRLSELASAVNTAAEDNIATDLSFASMNDVQTKFLDILEGGDTDLIPTGIKTLDAILGGGIYPAYVIIASRTSIGKTLILMDIARNACKIGKKVLFFSFEMPSEQLIARYCCRYTGITMTEQRVLQMTKEDDLTDKQQEQLHLLVEAMKKMNKWNITFVDQQLTPEKIKYKVRQYTAMYGKPDAVIVDYVQIIPGKARQNEIEKVSAASGMMQQIYKEFNVPVIAAAQINRAFTKLATGERNESNDPPQREDLKGTGSLEEQSDITITMTRDPNARECVMYGAVRKQRAGALGLWQGYFVGARQSVWSTVDEYEEEFGYKPVDAPDNTPEMSEFNDKWDLTPIP